MPTRPPKVNRRYAAYLQLHAAFPQAFPLDDAAIRPLAVSIRDEVAAWIERQGFDARTARALIGALQHHCSRETCQRTVVAGAMRINRHGELVEAVTEEGQAHAERRIAHRRAEREAVRPAPPQAKAPPSPKANAPAPVVAPPEKTLPTVIIKKHRRIVLPPQ